MIKQYIRQAIYMLKQHPLVTSVSILGTALAIALVMVMITLFQIRTANFVPEVNRDRTLYLSRVRAEPRPDWKASTNNSSASYQLVKDYFYTLKTPELVTTFSFPEQKHLSTATRKIYGEYTLRATDLNYWKYFQFRFLEGAPFDEGEFESGWPVAVISRELAETLFGKDPAVGKEILINQKPHRVSGVVEDVSRVSKQTFAHVWIPITSRKDYLGTNNDGVTGNLSVCFLARERHEQALIREEMEAVIKKMSDGNPHYIISVHTIDHIEREFFFRDSEKMREYFMYNILTIFFLLLLPAINLTGIAMNNIKERSSEIGIRKAFGATKHSLLIQILMENLVITVIGAIGGYLLSILFVHIGSDFLIARHTLITREMLLQPMSFFCVVVFCFLMNLMSAGLPAWRISRRSVTESLFQHEH